LLQSNGSDEPDQGEVGRRCSNPEKSVVLPYPKKQKKIAGRRDSMHPRPSPKKKDKKDLPDSIRLLTITNCRLTPV
jgi:hypothetical protein